MSSRRAPSRKAARSFAALAAFAALGACKREARPVAQQAPVVSSSLAREAAREAPEPSLLASASPSPSPSPSASASPSTSAAAPSTLASGSPNAPSARAFSLTLASGNQNAFGKPNAWAYVPAAYRADRPLRLIVVFHGFNSCIESLVSDGGVPCKPFDAPRATLELASQIDRSGTGAIVLFPQLAYDEKLGDPGVLDSGPALERLTREVLEGPLADAIGPRKVEDVERVAMFAISGGYQALYAALGPDGKGAFGDRLRDVALLDAYYAEEGAVDTWLARNLADFSPDAGRPRHLSVIYSWIETPRIYAQAFAARAAVALQREGLSSSLLHRDQPREPTVEELATPVSFLFSSKDHDDIPRADIARAISAFGI